MGYEKVFEKPYPTGWKDTPDTTTPILAGIMDDYDDAIEHIENHLEGTSAIFPIQATGGMTQPVGIDENGRLVTMPSSSGGETASEITYDNTESGLESTDVQGAIDELADGAGGSTAATTTYDNTESGLEATNCQDAIDEIVDIFDVSASGEYITTIFNTETTIAVNTELSLNETVKDFTKIRIKGYMSFNGKKLFTDVDLVVDDLVFGDNTKCYWFFIDANDLGYFYFNTDGDKVIWASVAGSVNISEIQGINYSQDSWTKLLDVRDESSQTASSYSLADDITNYNTIAVSGYFVHSLGNVTHVETLPIDMIEIDSSVHQICIDNSHVVTVKFPTSTSVESVGSAGGTYIYQVYGK